MTAVMRLRPALTKLNNCSPAQPAGLSGGHALCSHISLWHVTTPLHQWQSPELMSGYCLSAPWKAKRTGEGKKRARQTWSLTTRWSLSICLEHVSWQGHCHLLICQTMWKCKKKRKILMEKFIHLRDNLTQSSINYIVYKPICVPGACTARSL